MENKKGFTLVELLAVIVIIAVVASIATVGIISIRSLINESLLDSKIDVLESGAVYWGQDNMVLLVKDKDAMIDDIKYFEYDDSTYGYAAVMSINDLSDYISKGDTCYDEDNESYSCVKNDVTGEDMGNDLIYIYVTSNRVYAKYIEASDSVEE